MPSKTLHKNLTSDELHYSKIQTNPAPPSSIPTYLGESYYNTASNIFYIAIGTASVNDWEPVVTVESVNPQTGTTYTVLTTDNGKLINMTSSSARTVTLLEAPANGFSVTIFDGSGNAYTNNLDVVTTGSDNFYDGTALLKVVSNYGSIHLVYDQSTSKWLAQSQFIGSALLVDHIFDTMTIVDEVDKTKQIAISAGGGTTGTKTTIASSQTADRVLTLPNVTDTLVGLAATQTLSNKTVTGLTNTTNPIVMQGATEVRFNNAGNTFYSSIKGGNNTGNLAWTLPIVAPTAGQFLSSSDTSGTLAWSGTAPASQTTVASAANINALTSSFTTVVITGSTATNINGIVAGSPGQRITIINFVTNFVTLAQNSGSATAPNRIAQAYNLNIVIPPGYAIDLVYNSSNSLWYIMQSCGTSIPGGSTQSSISAGFIGETIRSYVTSGSISTSVTSLTSIPLTAGIWDISCVIQLAVSGGSGIVWGGISSSNSSIVPNNIGDNYISQNFTTDGSFIISAYRVGVLSSPTSYFAVAQQVGAVTVATIGTRLSACRVG